MKHYLLFYDAAADYLQRRAPLRAAHLEHARRAWRVREWTTVVGEQAVARVE